METGAVGSIFSPVGSTAVNSGQGARPAESGEIGKEDFLQLLVAQLKNQDPLDPIKNENFIAQLATFSSLEQLISIKEAVNKLAGMDETADTSVEAD
jgi:flagellar basal-body rod modification protein FlgD